MVGSCESRGLGSAKEKRRLLLTIRTALTVAIGYLLIFSAGSMASRGAYAAFVLVYLASNIAVALIPIGILVRPAFDVVIVMVDTAAVIAALYAMPDAGPEVLVVFFVVLLLATIGDRLLLSLLACVLASVAYFGLLLGRKDLGELLDPAILLRLPFFLLVGVYYVFFIDRRRRQAAVTKAMIERERARGEFLSAITEDIKQPLTTAQESAVLLKNSLSLHSATPEQMRHANRILRKLRDAIELLGLVPRGAMSSEEPSPPGERENTED